MSKLKIQHDLQSLGKDEAAQYLREISDFLGLDPDLNAFDLIWMPNPTGQGQTLCVYARRGTCELLRAKHEIEILDQNEGLVEGSYVVRVKGRNMAGRVEIAIGSRSLEGLKGRDRDDAIMTASTRALQRLTMQFTGLGILSESEVVSVMGQPVNPAADVKLAGSAMVIPPMPSVAPNNAPGKPVAAPEMLPVSQDPKTQAQVAAVIAIRDAEKIGKEADIKPDVPIPAVAATPVESTTSDGQEADKEPAKTSARKPRKTKTVTLDVEPEVVNQSVPAQANSAVPTQVNSVASQPTVVQTSPPSQPISVQTSSPSAPPSTPAPAQPVEVAPTGMPSVEQMADYRLRVSVFTKELPPSKNGEYGSVQRMRAFITRWNNGTSPAALSVKQWEDQIAFFNQFTTTNGIKGLIAYIGDYLGDNK